MKFSLAELIATQLRSADMTKTQAEAIASEISATLEANLAGGDTIVLGNVGSLERVQKAARAGRNPMTGEAVEIPEKLSVRFKPFRAFKKRMNEVEAPEPA